MSGELEPSSSGKAIQIVSVESGKFVLNEKGLQSVLLHPIAKDKPVTFLFDSELLN
jgi:hypothetical protein